MTFLKKSKAINNILNELSSEIKIRKTEFYDVKLDYFVITLYGEFEKEIDSIIEKKINYKNNFGKNYINFLKSNDLKLHRGLNGDRFKKLINNVFGVEILDLVSNNDWQIFNAFIDFRHTIAHSLPSYKQKKDDLTLKINNDTNNLITSLENILSNLEKISRTKFNY